MTELWIATVSAVALGAIYSLVALGFTIVYRATGVFNFAHPEFMLIGTLAFTTFAGKSSSEFGTASAIAIALTVLIVVAIFLLVIDRAAGQPHWMQLILTLGVAEIVLNVAQIVWDPQPRFLPRPVSLRVWHLPGGALFSSIDLFITLTCLVVYGVVYLTFVWSRWGIRLRAAAADPLLATYCGLRLRRWYGAAWAVGAVTAVVAGICFSLRVPVDPGLTGIGLLVVPGALVGGLGSINGALAGSFLLALLQQVASTIWSPTIATPLCFTVLLVILAFRPNGLFSHQGVERV